MCVGEESESEEYGVTEGAICVSGEAICGDRNEEGTGDSEELCSSC